MLTLHSGWGTVCTTIFIITCRAAAASTCSLGLPNSRLPDAESARVGHLLYFDTSISADHKISCASCHSPEFSFADNRPVSTGVFGRRGSRNAPTTVNSGFFDVLGWDATAHSLEEIISRALRNKDEMQVTEAEARRALEKHGIVVRGRDRAVHVLATKIAEYVRSLSSGHSLVDRYLLNNEDKALTASAVRGLNIFFGKAHCSVCHTVQNERSHPFGGSTLLFTDQRLHNLGMEPKDDSEVADKSDDSQEKSASFKTPSLRNVSRTAPYMHDGRFATLLEVVDFYNRGGGSAPDKDPILVPLRLTDRDKNDLVDFLRSLDGELCTQDRQRGLQ